MPALNRGFAPLTAQSHRHVGNRLTLSEIRCRLRDGALTQAELNRLENLERNGDRRTNPLEGDAMPGLIESSPGVMMGKPVVAGTRITVEVILEKLGAGESVDEVIAAHPRLTKEGVNAALAFAAEALRADVVYPAPHEAA
jgi:uncharacterized protein (DUF433 family)